MFRQKFLAGVLVVGILLSLFVPRASAAVGTCDWVKFIADVTVPDGMSFASGATFTKTWRLQNIGTCTWTMASYRFVFSGGEQMGSPASVKLPKDVAPNQTVDISVDMIAPVAGGSHQGFWKMSNASGALFGIGSSAADPVWVKISVIESNTVAFDFVSNASYAQWSSGAGPLSFPGTSGDSRGYALQVDNPKLEDGSIDPLPGLLTVPQNKWDGYIQGMYPEFLVQQGDRLQTIVNCEYGATGCYATFAVKYMTSSGSVKTFWTFAEAPEGRFYRANLDLSPLAGQKVKFILMILSQGTASGDRALWGEPRILRVGSGTPPPPPTLTPLPPLTPTATAYVPPPPTVSPAGCDKASFVTDVTVPDGTIFAPGAAFTKTWRLKNVGSCTWTTSYNLVFYTGDQMGSQTVVNFPQSASPGSTIDLSVNLTAPNAQGKYRGYWILRNPSGALFGIGQDAKSPFWLEINVTGGQPSEQGYDFAANACSAQWKSSAGALPCPGVEGDSKGFAISQQFTHLEDGTMGPAPSILVAPDNKFNGYIKGTYPTFTVQQGDHFRAGVGCEYGYSCYVTFQLDYLTASGSTRNFWTWREKNEGLNYTADINLSPLAGQSVRFILTVLTTGSPTGDRVRWTGPYIIHSGGASVPPTSAPPPIITPTFTPTPSGQPGPVIVPSPKIGGLTMIENINGWALGDPYVMITRDGGATWYNVTPQGMTGNVTGSFFPNVNAGWVIASLSPAPGPGSLYRTTDGGLNWVRYDVPFNSGYLQFLDNANGFALTITGAAMQKQSVALYRTSDGGATWVLKYQNDPTLPGAGTSLPLGGHKDGMAFRDTSTGWVGGDTPTDGYVYLYKTTDGGVNWARIQLTLPAGYESAFITINAPKFFGANDAILPVWMSTNTSRDLFIYVTHDGGATWTLSPGAAVGGKNTDFVSMNDAFTWNWNGYFLVTHNSGASWTQVTPNINFGDTVRSMEFVSQTTGWIVQADANGNTSLYRTNDGGATWTRLLGNATIPTPTTPPTTRDPAQFLQSIIDALNAKNFDVAKAAMNQSFGFAYWGSQGISYTPDLAIQSIQTNYIGPTTHLTADPNKDFNVLLGGLNPYSIMGLDPNKSRALFVSGWGLLGKDEAILYVTQLPNGSWYWHSVLIAVNGFNPNPSALLGPYAVILIASNDSLNIRSGAGVSNPIIGSFPYNATNVMKTGSTTMVDGAAWDEVIMPDGVSKGWVNSNYLTEYVPQATFCADPRIPQLISQLKDAVNRSDGTLLSSLISPRHGLNINYWPSSSTVNYTRATVQTIFTDSQIIDWGSGGGSGIVDKGTFAQVVQPQMLDVLNSSYQLNCDALSFGQSYTNVVNYANANIHYYSVIKPPTNVLDWRVWLIRIEYLNGRPYVFGAMHYVWEP